MQAKPTRNDLTYDYSREFVFGRGMLPNIDLIIIDDEFSETPAVLIDRARFERLRVHAAAFERAAEFAKVDENTIYDHIDAAARALQPGDLDPIP